MAHTEDTVAAIIVKNFIVFCLLIITSQYQAAFKAKIIKEFCQKLG
jgi:hypothetical protein